MMPRLRLQELPWCVSFAGLGLMALALLRSAPVFPPPQQSKIITDARGQKVAVAQPFKTIAGSHYLEVTHAPETLFKAGGPLDRGKFAKMLMSRFYPEVLKNDDLWNAPADIESLFAHADGVTFIHGNAPELWRRIGLTILTTRPDAGTRDENIFSVVRVANAARGDIARGEAIIADYNQAYADLREELRPDTLTNKPRVLPMGSSTEDWSRLWVFGPDRTAHDDEIAGIINATADFEDTGRQQEAERILAMNPDLIFVGGKSVHDFWKDPRWQGLKAVLNKRVYGGVSFRPGLPTWNLDERPLGGRWTAEVAHPDRLQPKMRELARDHFAHAYGYHLSDDEIDELLRLDENKGAVGYERFTKSASTNERSELAQ